MNVISSYIDSRSNDISGDYSSESVEDDLQGMQPYMKPTHSEECYPTVGSRSDTEKSRISVSSRLSMTRKAFHKRGALKTLTRFSLDHLSRILSQRGVQLIETEKAPKQSSINDDVKKFGCKVVLEQNMTNFHGELERNNDAFDEDRTAEDAVVEGRSGLLLLSSKRKSGRLNLSDENQLNVDADSGQDEDTSQEYTRMKTVTNLC